MKWTVKRIRGKKNPLSAAGLKSLRDEYTRAIESALGADVPERAQWLRALMAELERLANHFGDIGAICNDASFALMNAHTGMLREGALWRRLPSSSSPAGSRNRQPRNRARPGLAQCRPATEAFTGGRRRPQRARHDPTIVGRAL